MKSLRLTLILLMSFLCGASFVASSPRPIVAVRSNPKTITSSAPESWWQKLLRIAGISAAPTKQRGSPDPPKPGDIYIYNLGRGNGKKLLSGDYQSPIFLAGDDKILALTVDSIVRISVTGGPAEKLAPRKSILKLVGQSLDDRDQVLVLLGDEKQISVGIMSLTNWDVTTIPHETDTTEGKTMFARIAGDERVYCNTEVSAVLQCERDAVTKECIKDETDKIKKQWTDIFVTWPFRQAMNVTNSQGDSYRQPALSFDGTTLVYVKTAR